MLIYKGGVGQKKKGKNMFKKALYIICGTCIATGAMASGYQVSEYSATGIGRAFAGAGVVGDDFSSIAYNPAGMSYNKTNGAQLGAAAIVLHSDWKDNTPGGTGVKGSSKMARVLPNFFTQYRFNEDLTIGLGAYTPYGLITDYDNNKWPQGSHGLFSGLKAVDLSAGASYKLHSMVALGAALNAQYADAHLTATGQDLDGHDVALGYSVGMTVTPREDIRLGVSYRSKVSHDLHGGKLKTGMGSTPIYAKITTPEYVLFSGAYDVNKQWTLSASARWTRWSRFENLNIITKKAFLVYPAGTTISSTHENWKNTWFFALGADYKINENWTVRFGGAYDESVIKAPEYRTVRVPDGRRIFASLGASYMTGNWQYDLGYTHVWMRGGDATGGDERSRAMNKLPDVHYNNAGAYMAAFSVQYKF